MGEVDFGGRGKTLGVTCGVFRKGRMFSVGYTEQVDICISLRVWRIFTEVPNSEGNAFSNIYPAQSPRAALQFTLGLPSLFSACIDCDPTPTRTLEVSPLFTHQDFRLFKPRCSLTSAALPFLDP